MYRFLNYELTSGKNEGNKKTILSWASKDIEPAPLVYLWVELFVFSPRILVRNVLCCRFPFVLPSRRPHAIITTTVSLGTTSTTRPQLIWYVVDFR